MLRQYPGLTIVGGIAMAFAIAASASVFAFLNRLTYPRLPLAAYAMIMTSVCVLACIVPIVRALRIEPTEALRADG